VYGEDELIEEIARLHGYDSIPMESRAAVAFDLYPTPMQTLIARTRTFLVDAGYTEVVAPFLTDPESATPYGTPVELRNALGRDLSVLRTSVVPSMARVIAYNSRFGYADLQLFEIGTAFRRGREDQGVIPGVVETEELSIVVTGSAPPRSWDSPSRDVDIYDARGIAERYLARVGVKSVRVEAVTDAKWGFGAPALALFAGGDEVGRIGPIDESLRARHDIGFAANIVVIDLRRLVPHAFASQQFIAPSKYPSVGRDIAVVAPVGVANANIEATIRSAAGPLLREMQLFDLYAGKGIEEGKRSLAYALRFQSGDRTLEELEVDVAMNAIRSALKSEHGLVIRGETEADQMTHKG
jgi:phenylalanyl-tRNA synthetase beta chain